MSAPGPESDGHLLQSLPVCPAERNGPVRIDWFQDESRHKVAPIPRGLSLSPALCRGCGLDARKASLPKQSAVMARKRRMVLPWYRWRTMSRSPCPRLGPRSNRALWEQVRGVPVAFGLVNSICPYYLVSVYPLPGGAQVSEERLMCMVFSSHLRPPAKRSRIR